jgi:hypothetical protein
MKNKLGKTFLIISLLLFFTCINISAEIIDNVVISFLIPMGMEVNETMPVQKNFKNNTILLQQKGLNNREPESFKKYTRIIIKTSIKDDDFQLFLDNNELINSYDLQIISDYFFDNLSQTVCIVKRYTTTFSKIAGINTINFKYIRTSHNNEEMTVMVCLTIFNTDKYMQNITSSYRIEDSSQFKNSIDEFYSSIKIL